MIGSIYYLTDKSGIPRYVGKTIRTLEYRLKKHFYDLNRGVTHKNTWIKSIGKENIRIILISEYDIDILNDMEIYWISEYRKLGYDLTNNTNGGDGRNNFKMSDEQKNKISKSVKKSFTIEVRNKMSNSQKGRKHSEETKQKMSIKAKNISDEKRKKLSESASNKIFTDEHKKNISISKKGKPVWNKGKKMSIEQKIKISEKLKGIPLSEEIKMKMSISTKQWWNNKKQELK